MLLLEISILLEKSNLMVSINTKNEGANDILHSLNTFLITCFKNKEK